MSAPEPIAVVDIRRGDSIRFESADPATSLIAREYRAAADSSGLNEAGTYFLLDRPAPAVAIPHVPTLAWLKTVYGRPVLAIWTRGKEGLQGESTAIYRVEADITDFVPATAVPTEALDMLRVGCFMTVSEAAEIIAHFLAAVDRANGTAS